MSGCCVGWWQIKCVSITLLDIHSVGRVVVCREGMVVVWWRPFAVEVVVGGVVVMLEASLGMEMVWRRCWTYA